MSDKLSARVRRSAPERFARDGCHGYRKPWVAGVYGGEPHRITLIKAHISYSLSVAVAGKTRRPRGPAAESGYVGFKT